MQRRITNDHLDAISQPNTGNGMPLCTGALRIPLLVAQAATQSKNRFLCMGGGGEPSYTHPTHTLVAKKQPATLRLARGRNTMIYFDNAATSFNKPPSVRRAMAVAMRTCGGYARGGHAPALRAAEVVFDCRCAVATFFGAQPEQVVFTLNATHALNLALSAKLSEHTKVAISGYEHNAVMRPLTAYGASYVVLQSKPFDTAGMLQAAEMAIAQGAGLFVINHISNVYGSIAPLAQLDALLTTHNIPMIVDASQSAGHLHIDLSTLPSVVALCAAGHKGLLGPMGTGVLIVRDTAPWKPLLYGGTGSMSYSMQPPDMLPDRLECGTPNVVGIAGLGAGVQHLLDTDLSTKWAWEQQLVRSFAKHITSLHVITDPTGTAQAGVISATCDWMDVDSLAEALATQGVCVRSGLHCAPLAHQSGGTLDTGTVRFSFGYGNQLAEIGKVRQIIDRLYKDRV